MQPSDMQISELPTPCLILDHDKLNSNITMMNARMRGHGVLLRPHVKTAKSLDVARLINNGDTGPITVSTLKEAEYFFSGGFDDILYAVSIVPARLERVKTLMEQGCRLKLILDNIDIAGQLGIAGDAMNTQFEVLIEIDCDGHRAGLKPEDPQVLELATLLANQPGTVFKGFMTHAGGSYDCQTPEQIKQHAAREAKAIVDCAGIVRQAGLSCDITSVGSTPTATFADDLSGVSEVRAGVYVFQDLFQVGLGVCGLQDIALTVLTTVLSHKPEQNRLIIDAGGLALSKDHSTASQSLDCHYGLVCDAASGELIEGLQVQAVNQEHGLVSSTNGAMDFSRFPIGSQLRVLPNHACMTAAAHDRYYLLDTDGLLNDCWLRCNGW